MAEAADIKGISHSPACRWLRRTASVILGAPLVATLLAGPAAPGAQAGEASKAPGGSSTVDVTLDSLAPSAPVKGDTLTVSGTLTNRSKETVTDARVDLRVGPRLFGRTSIDAAAERTGYVPGSDPAAIGGKYTLKIAKLPSGITQNFTLSVPVGKLGLDDAGVYQFGVSLSGQTPRVPYEQVLGIERTFLPWQEDESDARTRITYLWPLIASAHLTAETGSDEQQTPVFADDDLAAELAPGGRLEQMVSLGSQLPVTWVIDPDLLAGVDAMTKSYRIKVGDTTIAGKNQAVAKQWLTNLETAVADDKVVALPFADPDLASLAHRGKNVSGSLSHLQNATEVAGPTVETVLHVKPSTDFAWPVEGAIDPSIVDVATSAGAHNVIARSDSLQETGAAVHAERGPADRWRHHRRRRRLPALQGLRGRHVQCGEFHPGRSEVPRHDPRAERPGHGHRAQHRRRTAEGADRRSGTVDGTRPARPRRRTVDAAPRPGGRGRGEARRRRDDEGSQYFPVPEEARSQELPTQAFQDIKATQASLDSFRVILTQPERVVTPFGNAINRSMSTSWRGRPLEAQQYRDAVRTYLHGLTNEVQLISKSDVTLSGRSATIPVTVQNKLVQGVDHLVLRLKSDNATRLKLNGGDAVAEKPIRIAGGHSQSVKFDASANANGQVQVRAQLYTEDGTPYGEEMTFTVKVSEVTPTVLLVIAGGLLLLVFAGIRMYTHRKRANADGPSGGDGGEPEQPSDPTPDTGPESGEPSGTGEKVDR